MTLINCPECDKKVSEEAPSCPSCGHPIKATTIEKTSKKWKSAKLLSLASVIIGFLLISTMKTSFIPGFLIFFGIIVLIISSIGKWWFHG